MIRFWIITGVFSLLVGVIEIYTSYKDGHAITVGSVLSWLVAAAMGPFGLFLALWFLFQYDIVLLEKKDKE